MFGFRKPLAPPLAAALAACLEGMPLLAPLTGADRERLRQLAQAFLRRKTIEGAAGLEPTDHMRATIALQAVLPVLHLDLDLYDGWHALVVYPDEFLAPYEFFDEAGVVHQGDRYLSGESWQRGPVILAWSHVEQDALDPEPAGSVVIHELAHKLDLLNGVANGMPPLHPHMSPERWSRVMRAAYDDVQRYLQRGLEPPIDAYAGESPGEFFAVVSELFFAWPESLRAAYPQVYEQLAAYYAWSILPLKGAPPTSI